MVSYRGSVSKSEHFAPLHAGGRPRAPHGTIETPTGDRRFRLVFGRKMFSTVCFGLVVIRRWSTESIMVRSYASREVSTCLAYHPQRHTTTTHGRFQTALPSPPHASNLGYSTMPAAYSMPGLSTRPTHAPTSSHTPPTTRYTISTLHAPPFVRVF